LEPGLQLLSDAVTSSRILNAGGGQDFGLGGQGGFGGDINDVDLEMALRASAEEYRQMEEAQRRAEQGNQETAIVNEDNKQANDEAQALNQDQNKDETDLKAEEDKLAEQIDKNLNVEPKKDLQEVTKIVNDPDFIGDIMNDLGLDDPALIAELTGQGAKVPPGTYEATQKSDLVEVKCSLTLKDDMTYSYKEDNPAAILSEIQTGTYKLDGDNVVCEPALTGSIEKVVFDKQENTVKLVLKNA